MRIRLAHSKIWFLETSQPMAVADQLLLEPLAIPMVPMEDVVASMDIAAPRTTSKNSSQLPTLISQQTLVREKY